MNEGVRRKVLARSSAGGPGLGPKRRWPLPLFVGLAVVVPVLAHST